MTISLPGGRPIASLFACVALACAGAGSAPVPEPGIGPGVPQKSVAADAETCDLKANTCPGLLPATFLASRDTAELTQALESAKHLLKPDRGAGRKKGCRQSCSDLFVTPYVSRFSRRFHFDDLDARSAIVFGAMRFPEMSPYVDTVYGVGKDREKDARLLYFVGYKIAPTPATIRGRVIAGWTLFGFRTASDGKKVVDSLASGMIRECKMSHDELKADTLARFISCEGDKAVAALASPLSPASFTSILDAGACPPGFDPAPGERFSCGGAASHRAALAAAAAPRAATRIASMSDAALATLADYINESIGLYWFSCANGCCTAEM